MLYLVYATLIAWLIMVIVNYHSHKKYIVKNKDKFLKILDDNYGKKEKIKVDDTIFFSFTPDNIEKREFTKYLNMGKFKYIISDTTQIMFSIVLIFILAYSLEYLPFIKSDRTIVDYNSVWQFILFGYVLCIVDAYSKTLKYDQVIKCWEKKRDARNK
ncbi:MAG: hypothetical protein KKD38_04520 [Candidatus Delongbacteria bacterium]|nr:hypothetical protein [Candidatus Delongbacteria bacterium]